MITHVDLAFILNFSLCLLQSQTSLLPFRYRSLDFGDLLILCTECPFWYIYNGLVFYSEEL